MNAFVVGLSVFVFIFGMFFSLKGNMKLSFWTLTIACSLSFFWGVFINGKDPTWYIRFLYLSLAIYLPVLLAGTYLLMRTITSNMHQGIIENTTVDAPQSNEQNSRIGA
ncbi:hypothetical protein IC619_000375 [Hazenella sp. IB182353]|uniref:hypothetical protein n=1 Tax=Polycladospora coralii TaxID=2771432 RepID=UPI0017474AD1|nr:hypothetical protein [Polycladospora coralii]MBS7528946.1 hypothetical protein [Polycladospora coralii]